MNTTFGDYLKEQIAALALLERDRRERAEAAALYAWIAALLLVA